MERLACMCENDHAAGVSKMQYLKFWLLGRLPVTQFINMIIRLIHKHMDVIGVFFFVLLAYAKRQRLPEGVQGCQIVWHFLLAVQGRASANQQL